MLLHPFRGGVHVKIEKMNVRRSGVGWLISLLVVSVFLFNPGSIHAGDSAADTFERVDKVFARWDKFDSPGCALAVVREGKIIYKKCYGMANLDHDIPIRLNTIFRIGSISKQFTAAAILMLHLEGKLSLDDNIRKYIPQMAEYQHPITIRHLIHHMSGIRDYEYLQYFSGELNNKAEHTNDDIIALTARQKGLKFTPGEQFSYSNSNYTILASIIEKAAGMPFPQFAKKRIFQPLGMKRTFVYNDNTAIVKHRATGYRSKDNGFAVNETLNESTGDGGIFTTVEDFFLWDQNFYKDQLFKPGFMRRMQEVGVLNDGSPVGVEYGGIRSDYAFGLSISTYRGLKTVGHGGAYVGFRAMFLQFPEQRFSVICLSNFAGFNSRKVSRAVADIFLEKEFPTKKETVSKKAPAQAKEEKNEKKTVLSIEQLQAYTGCYRGDELLVPYELGIRDGQLHFTHTLRPSEKPLEPVSPDTFVIGRYMIKFTRDAAGKVTGFTFDSGEIKGITLLKQYLKP
jgi:CubicO group peptidase (beta-lactamase class C family)